MRRREFDGDPYVPGHGDVRYAVRHYDLDLTYRVTGNQLAGVARLSVEVLATTKAISVDLSGLKVTSIKATGLTLPAPTTAPAKAGAKSGAKTNGTKTAAARPPAVAKWSHTGGHLAVTFTGALPVGTRFELTVAYRGNPQPLRGPDGMAGWEELADGVIVASQPHGSPSWFPCNDRASDKATYRISVATDQDYAVVSGGVREPVTKAGRLRRWTYRMDAPMSPYLATVQIGPYAAMALPPGGSGVPMTVWHTPRLKQQVVTAWADQPAMMDLYCELFGPYPFEGYDVVVTEDDLDIPLESQAMSTFGANFASRDWERQRLIAHELAHSWFGNAVTCADWADVWLHEGFACYAEWLWSPHAGEGSTDDQARRHYDALAAKPQDLVIGQPGPDDMFDDRVYKRGALALHALRVCLGEETFFAVLRAWVARHRFGVVMTRDFFETVLDVSGADRHRRDEVAGILDAWVYAAPLPPFPSAGSPTA